MKVYGKIINTIPEERIVKIEYNGRLIYLYMSRKLFKDFGPYFYNKPYIFVEASEKSRRLGDILVYDVESFVKVVEPNLRERKVFYDISTSYVFQMIVLFLLFHFQNKILQKHHLS